MQFKVSSWYRKPWRMPSYEYNIVHALILRGEKVAEFILAMAWKSSWQKFSVTFSISIRFWWFLRRLKALNALILRGEKVAEFILATAWKSFCQKCAVSFNIDLFLISFATAQISSKTDRYWQKYRAFPDMHNLPFEGPESLSEFPISEGGMD